MLQSALQSLLELISSLFLTHGQIFSFSSKSGSEVSGVCEMQSNADLVFLYVFWLRSNENINFIFLF